MIADPATCSFQFKATGTESFTTGCDVAKATLVNLSVNYDNQTAPAGSPATVKVGDKSFVSTMPDFAKEIDCTSWAQLFLKYNLSHPAVTAVIPGTDKPQYMLDNLNAGRGRMPDAAMRRRIETWYESV